MLICAAAARGQILPVDSFPNAASVQVGNSPGLDWVNYRHNDVTVAWDPNQKSPNNPNSGAMYITVNWPTPTNSNFTTGRSDMQFTFSTADIGPNEIFDSSSFISFECDIKVDLSNSYPAMDGSYGAVELVVNPYTSLVSGSPILATNGWQHFAGYFSAITGGDYAGALVGLISQRPAVLTNKVACWLDNVRFTKIPPQTTVIDSFASGSSVTEGPVPGLDWMNTKGESVSIDWDPNQTSPNNPNDGAMYVSIHWPGTNATNFSAARTDVQFTFSTGVISPSEDFYSTNYASFSCDLKIDTTNSFPAMDGSYGAVELAVNPWEPLAVTVPLAATNGWQHITGYFASVPEGVYAGALIGLVSQQPGILTNTVSYWIDNIVFTQAPQPIKTRPYSVLTYKNDNSRSGVNTNEIALTPTTVNTNTFGLLFTYPVDGWVAASPLIMTNVTIPGKGVHNVAFIATEHDSVYAFDADSDGGANSAPLWQTSFLNAAAGVTTVSPNQILASTFNIAGGAVVPVFPEFGITSTPVIDPTTGTIYVEAETVQTTNNQTIYSHSLHALDVTTGAEKFGGPVVINPSVAGIGDNNNGAGEVTFDAINQLNEAALLLVNGTVYVAYGSPLQQPPYHGWLVGIDAHSLQQTDAWNTTPNGSAGGILMSGNGPAADSAGNIYLVSSEGAFNTNSDGLFDDSIGGSVIKLATTNGLAAVDYFRPFNESALETAGASFGSGGVVLLPDSAGTIAHPHLMMAGGGGGAIYLMDRDNLGEFNATSDSVVQELTLIHAKDPGAAAYFNGAFYMQNVYANMRSATLVGGALASGNQGPQAFTNGANPVISSDGTNNGIVWALDTDNYAIGGPAILYAYPANNISAELYDSTLAPLRDTAVPAVEFAVPTVAGGKVYVGGQYGVSVYGVGNFVGLPTFTPSGGVVPFTNSIMVTISDPTPGATIYYTLDGTTPTTNAAVYQGPLTIASSAKINALAIASGGIASAASGPSLESVGDDMLAQGTVTWANYPGASRAMLESPTFTNSPAFIEHLSIFELPEGEGGTFADSLAGYFTPPQSGDYVFFIAAACDSDLFLSTDSSPTNACLIAQETAASNERSWLSSFAGSSLTAKRSDQFAGTQWPGGGTVHLQGGVPYYIRAVHHAQPNRTSYLGVTYKLAGAPDPVSGAAPALAGSVLSSAADAWASITITTQPASVTNNIGTLVQFGVAATSYFLADAVGGSGPPIHYQWQSSAAGSQIFTNVTFATNQYIAKGLAALTDNGSQYQVILNSGTATVTSSVATLTVISQQRANVPVLTYRYDNARTGANTNEANLTPGIVANTNTFGMLFTCPVDGYVFAQPLIMTNVVVPGKGTHNVLYVVTEHDSIYAFDADNNQGSNSVPLWQTHLINPLAGVTNLTAGAFSPYSQFLGPEVGSTATPVIDPASGTLYMVAYTMEFTNGVTNYIHRLHALDIATGAERPGSPALIMCTNYIGTGAPGFNDTDGNGHVGWFGSLIFCRSALLLDHGNVYVSMTSHVDLPPFHGWLFAFNATNLQQTGVFNTTPNGNGGALWMSGGGPVADSAGNIYTMSGNGDFSTAFADSSSYNVGESIIKLSTTNGLSLLDYFTPWNNATLSINDQDLGSGGLLLLPDAMGTPAHPHLLLGGGKEGILFLTDRDHLGQYNPLGNSQVVQSFVPDSIDELPAGGPGSIFTTPTLFNNRIYFAGGQYPLREFPMSNGQISANYISAAPVAMYDGMGAIISSDGTNNAIAWQVDVDARWSGAPAVLYAFDANNLSHELYDSSLAGARDMAGVGVRFSSPIVANGKVYLGCQYAVDVFGSGVFLAAPTIEPGPGTFTNSITISLSDSSPGVTMYYTLDGRVPTTQSTVYTGPFALTNTAVLNVIATAPGAVNSAVSAAPFVNSASSGGGAGLYGQYFSGLTTNDVFEYTLPPTLTRIDPVIDFYWTSGVPDPSIQPANFGVMWSGMIQPRYSENYTLYLRTPCNARLWINGDLLIDTGTNLSPPQTIAWSAPVNFVGQQYYNVEIEFYSYYATFSYNGNPEPPSIEFMWSGPSTPMQNVPESQLYPETNPPPAVVITCPSNEATYSGTASVTFTANAADQYNSIASVGYYANGSFLGAATNPPYSLTVTGFVPGNYQITAVAADSTGLTNTSVPLAFIVNPGSGAPYGLSTNGSIAPFLNQNMPGAFSGTFNGSIPALLSQTGAYAVTSNRAPTSGLIPYSPNTILWSDGAAKSRFLAVPNVPSSTTPAGQIGFASTGQWTFPAGTVFVKNFDMVVNTTNANVPARRLETRLLVRDTNGSVYGVTYKWRPDNTDAELLTNSLNETLYITNATGVASQTWYYPSPSDCLQCHTAVAGYVLGVNSRQLNGTNFYPSTGVWDNQLRTLNRLGMLNPAINEAAIPTYESLSAITNPSASLEERARSYLDANCAQCHQPGGSGPTFDARYDTPLTNQNIINTRANFSLGYDNMCIVKPEDIWRSAIYQRINTANAGIKMPTLARNVIDTNAVAVFVDWINSLPGTPAEAPPVISPVGGTFVGGVTVAISAPDQNATIYYTLDGSLPTTNSLEYTGPIQVTNSVTITANAADSGLNTSIAPNQSYIINPGVSFVLPGYFADGWFILKLSGPPHQNYTIQSSVDLLNWTDMFTITPDNSPFSVSLPETTNAGANFYRAIQQP